MIVIHRIGSAPVHTKCGRGKVTSPQQAVEVHADGRELEQVLKNAPFLRGQPAFPQMDNDTGEWLREEAIAAVLAFNHNEEE